MKNVFFIHFPRDDMGRCIQTTQHGMEAKKITKIWLDLNHSLNVVTDLTALRSEFPNMKCRISVTRNFFFYIRPELKRNK